MTFLLSIVLLITVAACNELFEEETTQPESTPDIADVPVTDDATDIAEFLPPEEDEILFPLETRVGFIYSGVVGADPLIAMFEAVREQLAETLGAETCYIEDVRVLQFEQAVEKLIADGCNVIVAASVKFSNVTKWAARDFPDIAFISFGSSDTALNLSSIQPSLFEAANVCGLIAAYNTETNKIGIVADVTMYSEYRIIIAFALGAEELQSEIYLNWAWSTHYEETRAAVLDLVEQGCDIIFVYQYDEYAMKLCEELGVTVIGFAHDVPVHAPENYLTGMYLNLNTIIIEEVRGYMYGSFSGELHQGGLSHGTLGLIRINESIAKQGTAETANALIEQITDESFVIFSGEIVPRENLFAIDRRVDNVISEKNFSEPLTDLIYSDLTIKE